MDTRAIASGLWCAMALPVLPAAGHVNLANAIVRATTDARSTLATGNGSNTVEQPGGTGAFPNWQGFSNAGQTLGQSGTISMCDFSLFMNSKLILANGFANAWVKPGADLVSAHATAVSKIEIEFNVHGPHHYQIRSVDVGQLNGVGSAVMLHEGAEVFRYEALHVHEIRGALPEGDYTIVLTASTESGTSGANSVGIFELEFEVIEGLLCLADFNDDRLVDDADFVGFAEAYDALACPGARGGRHEEGCPADLNADHVVDDADFVLFAAAYNDLICP